jgi:hypothetical protein
MELTGSGKHGILNFVPKHNGGTSECFNGFVNLSWEILCLELMLNDGSIDSLNRNGKNHVEYEVLPLETVGDIITTTTWMLHGSDVDETLDILEITSLSLIQHVESSSLYQLSDDLQSDLVTPLVNKRHRHIIYEYSHHLTHGRCEVLTNLEITLSLDSGLEHRRRCGRREVDSLEKHPIFVELLGIHEN